MQSESNARRSMSHIERQRSLQGEHANGVNSPLQLFSKAKSKINKTFQDIAAYLDEASSFLEERCYISEEFVNEVDKSSNEVGNNRHEYEYWIIHFALARAIHSTTFLYYNLLDVLNGISSGLRLFIAVLS